MTGTVKNRHRPDKISTMVKRSGLSAEAFDALIDRVWARRSEVPASIERLAAAGRRAGIPLLSHDDMSPDQRAWFREIGCPIAEFPIDEATTEAAHRAGDEIVFGAPNVVRGGSHIGCPSAAEMVRRSQCTILASDYYYPALLAAPFRLAAEGILDLAAAWALVSSHPARALGLEQGRIAPGAPGDAVVVDAGGAEPRLVATVVGGRILWASDWDRLG
jgi:alpha-D-ribose 1-methylphosphonate 5-triphosphate diphosphatase